MSKHTPGTWRLTEVKNSVFKQDTERYEVHSEMDTIAIVNHWNNEPEESKANAQLIASAPELLAALEACIIPLMRLGDFVGNVDKGGASGLGGFDRCSIILQAKSAIEKAKGE